ncbi:glycosyltransferase [Psychrobacillus sp. FSL K6-1464]|uniref:glycosyltransferase n=1 Tax=Psychrobacillus sp. FSL K6-1464 TaxID=2921545 RepID=UPI0030F6FB0F
MLIPAFNEGLVLLQCLESWQRLNYDNKEAIFINDGSTDNTMNVLHELLDLLKVEKEITLDNSSINFSRLFQSKNFPQIYVIDQLNGGKSAALNAGISIAT